MRAKSIVLVGLGWTLVAACAGDEPPDSDGGAGGSVSVGGAPSGGRGTGGAAGNPAVACPAVAPASGSSCPSPGQRCAYQDCAGAGLTVALCQNTWSLTTTPCADTVRCAGSPGSQTCSAGQVCVVLAGGTIYARCVDNTCGTGPVECDCLGACSGVCTLQSNTTGVTMYCNSCPQGTCA